MAERAGDDDFLSKIERDAKALSSGAKPQAPAQIDPDLEAALRRDYDFMRPTETPTDLGRMAAVGGRALVSGAPPAAFGLPALAADAYESLVNLAKRGYNVAAPAIGAEPVPYTPAFRNLQALGQAGQQLASNLPIEAPRTPGERILTQGVESALGAATGGAIASTARGLIPAVAPAVAPATAAQTLQQAATQAAGQYARSASASPVLTTAGAGTGGAAAQLSSERGGTPGQNILAGLIGGALPTVAASAATRAVTPFTSNINPEQQRLLTAAREQYGLQPTAGQALGIPRLQYMENVASELPGAVRMRAAQPQQERAFQSAVMRQANVPGDLATPEALRQARNVAGGRIRELAETTPVIPVNTPEFADDLTKVVRDYYKTPQAVQKEAFANWVTEIASTGGAMSGTQYQEIRRQINDQAKRYSRSSVAAERDYGEALRGVRNALDNAFERATSKTKREDLTQARRDYALAKTIERAAGGAGGASGEISGPRFRQAVEAEAPALYRQGYGDLNELARIGSTFYPRLPQSGTEARASARAMLSPGQLGSEVMKSAVLAPFGALSSTALLNPATQAWLRNQALAGRRPPVFTSISPAAQGGLYAAREAGLLGQ
jgi:hypothetical protein